jgi:hypothetical protein
MVGHADFFLFTNKRLSFLLSLSFPPILPNVQTVCYDRLQQEVEADITAYSHAVLSPGHAFNSSSTSVSFIAFCIWLFASPHQHAEEAADLDRKCTPTVMVFT